MIDFREKQKDIQEGRNSSAMMAWGIRYYIKQLGLGEDVARQITSLSPKDWNETETETEESAELIPLKKALLKKALRQLELYDSFLKLSERSFLALENPQRVPLENPQMAYYAYECEFTRLKLGSPITSKGSSAKELLAELGRGGLEALEGFINFLLPVGIILYLFSLPVYAALYYLTNIIPSKISTEQFFWIPQVIGAGGIMAIVIVALLVALVYKNLPQSRGAGNKLWCFFANLLFPLTFLFCVLPAYCWARLQNSKHEADTDFIHVFETVFMNFNFPAKIKQAFGLLNLEGLAAIYRDMPAEKQLREIQMRAKRLNIEIEWLKEQIALQDTLKTSKKTANETKRAPSLSLDSDSDSDEDALSETKTSLMAELNEVQQELEMMRDVLSLQLDEVGIFIRGEYIRELEHRHDAIIAVVAKTHENIRTLEKGILNNFATSIPVRGERIPLTMPLLRTTYETFSQTTGGTDPPAPTSGEGGAQGAATMEPELEEPLLLSRTAPLRFVGDASSQTTARTSSSSINNTSGEVRVQS